MENVHSWGDGPSCPPPNARPCHSWLFFCCYGLVALCRRCWCGRMLVNEGTENSARYPVWYLHNLFRKLDHHLTTAPPGAGRVLRVRACHVTSSGKSRKNLGCLIYLF